MARILNVQILVDTETDAGSTDGLNELFHSAEGFVLDWGYKRPDGSYIGEEVGTEYEIPEDYDEGDFIDFIEAREKANRTVDCGGTKGNCGDPRCVHHGSDAETDTL